MQKRFVVFGLGGSGKTQFCCKFASDNKQRYSKKDQICILMSLTVSDSGVFLLSMLAPKETLSKVL